LILLRALKDLSAGAIANELETRLVVPKDRFLAQYLIPSKLASLTPERELQVCMPFAGDLPNNNFAAYEAQPS
jgi:hypothetical protein